MREIEPSLLDDISGAPALQWANEWSEETERKFSDPVLKERIRASLDADDRIPYVRRRGNHLYNFWRDAEHPRGVWRRTTLESYCGGETTWEVLVDVDKLAALDGEDWVWKGATLLPVSWDRALVHLSRGGADAVEIREFDVKNGRFF